MKTRGWRRRDVLLAAGIVTVVVDGPAASSPGAERPTNGFVFASYGGTYQAAEESALIQPFVQKNQIKFTSTAAPELAKIRAAVQTKIVQWDVIELSPGGAIALEKLGMLEPIDYAEWNKATLDAVDPRYRIKYAVAADIYADGIAYRTDTGKPHPTTWKEFWDLKAFPGPRTLMTAEIAGAEPWEAALLADGVEPSKLYPLDFNRATRSLDKIKSSITVWAHTVAQGVQALTSGDAIYGLSANGRILQAKQEGAKVDFEWNQALLYYDYFVVPKGAPDRKNAMKWLAFALSVRPQADLMRAIPYGLPNKDALKLIDPSIASQLPTYPSHLKQAIVVDVRWYGEESDEAGLTNQEKGLKIWNQWFGR